MFLFYVVIEVSRKKWGERMLKEHRVSPACSLAWRHCTLYSRNNITHSSSGRRLKFNTFIRHFYYLLLSFHSCFSPHTLSHLYSCFFFYCPFIYHILLPPFALSLPTFMSPPTPPPVRPAELRCGPLGSLLPRRCAFATHFKQAPLWD